MSRGVSVHDCSMWVQTEQDASQKPHSLKNYSTKQKPSAEKYSKYSLIFILTDINFQLFVFEWKVPADLEK